MLYYADNQRHLVCVPYSVENLHEMAKDLGIKRAWYDPKPYPHYDIPKRRVKEIQSRCIIVRPRTILEIVKNADPE